MDWSLAEQDAFRRRMGERLRRARAEMGLTQAEVAQAIGLQRSALSLAERGIRKIDAVELSRFAQLYGQSMDMLAKGESRDDR